MSEIITIDLNEYKEVDDWDLVKRFGVEYIILRIRSRYRIDTKFVEYYEQAKKLGIKIGVYKQSYAMTLLDAENEAIQTVNSLAGRPLDLPIFYEIGWTGQNGISNEVLTDIAIRFNSVILKSTPYKAGLYCDEDIYNRRLDGSKLIDPDLWVSSYGGKDEGYYNKAYKPDMDIVGWQYTRRGEIPGIPGYIDLNVFYKDYGILLYKPGWHTMSDGNKKLYLSQQQCVCNSWINYEKDWYFFDQSGNLVTDIWYLYHNKWYYINIDGKLVTGLDQPNIHTVNGSLRYPGLIKNY